MDDTSHRRPLIELLQDDRLIEDAINRGAREALLRHKQAGHPIAVWREGKVAWIAPEDIEVE